MGFLRLFADWRLRRLGGTPESSPGADSGIGERDGCAEENTVMIDGNTWPGPPHRSGEHKHLRGNYFRAARFAMGVARASSVMAARVAVSILVSQSESAGGKG